MVQRILRLPAVLDAVGLCQSSVYAKIKNKTFPQPIPLSDRAVGWLESEIADWQQAQTAKRGQQSLREECRPATTGKSVTVTDLSVPARLSQPMTSSCASPWAGGCSMSRYAGRSECCRRNTP